MNKFTTVSFLLLVLISIQQLSAQTTTIKGTVISSQNNLPVEYCSIALLAQNDTVVAGTITNKQGQFSFSKIPVGNYRLTVYFVGYEKKILPIALTKKGLQLDNIILMYKSTALTDVVVSGKAASSSNKIDKQTYKANQFEAAKGGTAVDVLKNLPSVAVNGLGEISVRGSTGFLVLINGKPVLTDAQTVLSQLPANSIENIELITAPSAKYDADGKGGIINIITRKGTTDGIGLSANLQGGLPSTTDYHNLENPVRFGGDITLNIKQKKWDISIGGNYLRNDINGHREGDVYTINQLKNTITRFPSIGERSFDRYNYAGRTSIVFTPGKNDVFSLGFFAGKKFQERRADLLYNNSTTDLTTNTVISRTVYFNSNLQRKEGNFTLGNIDYTHTFKNKSSLSASLQLEHATLYGNTTNSNLNYPAKDQLIQQVTNPYSNPIDGYRVNINHSINIGKCKLESGYQFRYDLQEGIFDYNVNPATNQTDTARFRGTAKTKNNINAVYTQFSGKINKLQFVAGIRYEYATRELNLSYDPSAHILNLSNLFPSVNLLYSINNAWNAKAGYSRRVQRNNNFELNPIPEREHSETLEQGDPDLLPQFVDLVELGVNHTFKKGTFFATVYYQHIKNPIQRVNSVYADTILNRIFTNADRARLFGLEIGTNLQPTKWFTLYLGANIYNYKIDGNIDILGVASTVENAAWVYSINSNATFNLGKKWSLQTAVNYLSNRPTALGEDSRFLVPNTTIKKSFMEGRYTIGLLWQNMNLGFLDANKQRITTSGKDFYTTTNYIYETDVLMLNFSININKISSKSKLPASELGEKEF